VRIGSRDGANYLAGRVDEVAIYDKALSAPRLATHYSAVFVAPSNQAPTPTISQPMPSTTFRVGDVVSYAGSATDVEDGALAGSALTWDIRLHHCQGTLCHLHPYLQSTGATGSFTVPDHGGDDVYFELVLTATDSAGDTGTASVSILPQTTPITIASSPSGLNVFYAGVSGTTPFTVDGIVGGVRTVTAPNQGSWVFDHWSDGGASSHTITVGTSPAMYTAFYSGTSSQGYSSEVLADQPIGYWRLGETSGTTAADSSGNQRSGTYVNAPTLGAASLLSSDPNASVRLNGTNQYVEVPNAGVWNLTGDLTIEALVNVTGGGTYRTIVAKHDANGDVPVYEFRIQGSTGKLQFVQKTTGGAFLPVTGNAVLSTGTTYHVAVTRSGNTITLYVNGALDRTQTVSGTIATNTRPVRIGSRDGTKFLAGRIDEVAIYDQALSATRIAAHYAVR
jgi:hypothetical protein